MGESTTIDSIQIEIQSNSTNAASGIDALAASLGNLKKQTISKTAISNLESFSNVIKNFGNVHGASNALRTLANSIEKLKSVGTVSSLTKSLTALPTALKALENVNLGGVTNKARELADAVSPLSSVKAGGLGTMIRNLSKLEETTKNLDDTKIAAFAAQVKKVSDALGPLSAKMTTIKEGFRGLNTVVKQTNVSIDQANAKVNVGVFNFSNLSNVLSSLTSVIHQVARGFANILNNAMQWDGVKYQFGNAFGEQADIYYEKITEMTDALRLNKQMFMENSAMAASMLIGFGVDKEDAREMGVGYTQLAYDIWAAYNNVYKSFDGADGVMAAVRSAIAGEVEPIRRAGFTIIESQLEQTAANHGLAISLETATEAQKSYLRYLELVDQAQAKGVVGTYAREMETAEGLTRTLTQQLKSLGQAFGSLFIPMIVKALPYVQAFVELLTEGVHWIASLFGIEIQDISGTWNDYSTNVETAVGNTEDITGAIKDAEDQMKALKNASIGIDELNVISEPASSSSGGSGGSDGGAGGGGFDGLDIDSLWDESIFDSVQSQVDSIKQKLKGMFDDWLPTLEIIGGALAGWGIGHLLGQLGEALQLGDTFEDKVKNIKKIAGSAIIIALQFKLMDDAFSDFMGEDGTILDYLEGVLIGAASTYLLYKQWGVGGLSIGLGITAAVSLKTLIEEGGITDVESLTVALTGLASALGAVATGASALSDAWKKLQATKFIGDLGAFISLAKEGGFISALAAAFPKLSTALAGLPGAISSASAFLATAAPWIALATVVVGGIVLAFVDYDFSEVSYTIGYKIGEALRNTVTWIADVGVSIWEGLKSAFEWVKNAFEIDDFWDILAIMFVPGEWIKRITPELTTFFTDLNDAILTKVENLKGNINEIFGGLFDGIFEGLGIDMTWAKEFADIFDIEYLDIVEAVANPSSVGASFITEIFGGIQRNWPEVKKFFTEDIPKFFTDTIPEWGSKISNAVSTAFESATSAVDKWWDEDVVPFFTEDIPKFFTETIPEWGNEMFYSLGFALGTAASAIVNWWNDDVIPFFTEDIPTFFTDTIPTWGVQIGTAVPTAFTTATTAVSTWWTEDVKPFFTETIPNFFTEDIPKWGAKIGEAITTAFKTATTAVTDWWEYDVKPIFTEIIPNFISTLPETLTSAGENIWNGVTTGVGNGVSKIGSTVKGWGESLVDGFKEAFKIHSPSRLMRDEIGTPLIDGIVEGMSLTAIRDKLSEMWENAKTWWSKKGNLSTYTPSIGDISKKISSAWETAKTWWKEKRSSLSYTPSIGKISSNLYDRWVEAKDWWKEKRSNLSYTPSIGKISTKLSDAWTTAKNWWNKSRSSLSYTPSIGSIKDKIISAWNSAKTWWKNNVSGLSTKLSISIPKISIKWDTVSALGKEFRYPTGFKLEYAAQGGIFDQGSLVWAGERGPEIVANAAGGKTGVMNVEQMQDAVYEGVFAAITAAMSGKSEGGAQAVNVYLDGRMITSSVEKHQRERGASIMGNEVYSY